MKRKFTAFVAAATLAASAFAPAAEAQHYRHGGGYSSRYYGHYRHDGDAAAAGVLGLVLGLALGSAIANSDRADRGCYDRCGNYPPPPPPQYQGYDPGRGGPPPPNRYSYDQGYRDGSAYEQDYGVDPKLDGAPPPDQRSQCTRQVRQWDRYANRYVTVDVPC